VDATVFQTSPYHWPTIGWQEDIEGFTLADLKAHYSLYYNPVNAFLVVVGDFRKEEMVSRIEKAFGRIPKVAERAFRRALFSDNPYGHPVGRDQGLRPVADPGWGRAILPDFLSPQ
jgi:predicted Zn-dependent peptidase